MSEQADKKNLLDMNLVELQEWVTERGWPKFRAEQILDWVYRKQAGSFEEMTNLSKSDRKVCDERMTIYQGSEEAELIGQDDTRKFLLAWPDGEVSETVIIPDSRRRTVCVSTQKGCPVGCVFCASGARGFGGNLSAGQIVEQLLKAAEKLTEEKSHITNIVFMGIGEPLLNYENLVKALRTLNARWGMEISWRRITVSTVGLPEKILKLAEEKMPVNLALSLHAPDDDLRRELIPWPALPPIEESLAALRYYFERMHRETTIEYVLLAGVNSSLEHARKLIRLLTPIRRWRCNVNLITYNTVPDSSYAPPSSEQCRRFLDCLKSAGINAHLRPSRGRDIAAACGQLRRIHSGKDSPIVEEASTRIES
jgi:23S rRNA (adenine2503-C2)-methyltransferase